MKVSCMPKGHIPRLGYRRLKIPGGRRLKTEQVLVWEQHHGPVPPGKELHYVNGNKLDIIALAAGGTDDRANLQALCKRHHSVQTDREDGGLERLRRTVCDGLGKMDRDRYTGRKAARVGTHTSVGQHAFFHGF